MNKKSVYVISDIHGQVDLFKALLNEYNPQKHQLVLISDLIDRGKFSKECLLLGKELVEKEATIYLKGNHEELFLNFLVHPEDWFQTYIRNGGKETIESLLHIGALEEYSPTENALMIHSRYKDLVGFLKNRPFYYEWKNFIFVHAGLDLLKAN